MAVIVEAYVQGVSTRRVEDLVQSLGIEKLSKSQVSELAKELDVVVKAFRERKLSGRYRYLWLDALMIKSREGGRVANVASNRRRRYPQSSEEEAALDLKQKPALKKSA